MKRGLASLTRVIGRRYNSTLTQARATGISPIDTVENGILRRVRLAKLADEGGVALTKRQIFRLNVKVVAITAIGGVLSYSLSQAFANDADFASDMKALETVVHGTGDFIEEYESSVVPLKEDVAASTESLNEAQALLAELEAIRINLLGQYEASRGTDQEEAAREAYLSGVGAVNMQQVAVAEAQAELKSQQKELNELYQSGFAQISLVQRHIRQGLKLTVDHHNRALEVYADYAAAVQQ